MRNPGKLWVKKVWANQSHQIHSMHQFLFQQFNQIGQSVTKFHKIYQVSQNLPNFTKSTKFFLSNFTSNISISAVCKCYCSPWVSPQGSASFKVSSLLIYMSCLCWLTPCLTCVLQAQDWRTDGSCWKTRAGDPQGQIHHNQPPPAIIFQKSRKWLKCFFSGKFSKSPQQLFLPSRCGRGGKPGTSPIDKP